MRGFSGRLTLTPEQIGQATALMQRIEAERETRREGRRVMLESLFVEFLLFLCRRFSEDSGPATRVMPVARAIGYMNRHYAESMCLDDLVVVSGLSKRSLIRYFKHTTGAPPMRYLQKVRVAKARSLLRNGEHSITRIAMDTGFNDAAYFSFVFKRHTGCAPTRYQERVMGTRVNAPPKAPLSATLEAD